MAGSANTTVTRAGMAAKESSSMTRRGPGNRSVQSTRRSRPNPTGAIRSAARSIKGPDKGAGGGS